jgi:gliding motility-associated-like protein
LPELLCIVCLSGYKTGRIPTWISEFFNFNCTEVNHLSIAPNFKNYIMKKNIIQLFFFLYCSFCFSQDFIENFDNPAIIAPSGMLWPLPDSGTWYIFDNNIGTQQSWTLNTEGIYPANSNPHAAYINRENIGQGNTSHDYLATPLITFPANPQLRFRTRTTLQTQNGTIFEIRAASASSNPELPESYTILLASWTEDELNENYDVYEEKVVNLTLPEPEMYIAFVRVVTQTGSGITGDRWLIDDIKITSECLNAENLAAVPSATSALLSWDSPGPASQWYVHILPAGVPLSDASAGVPILAAVPNSNLGFTVTQTTQNPSGPILPGVEYVFWIQSVCDYETAGWISSAAFTTETLPEVCGGNYVDNGGVSGNYSSYNNTVTTICSDNPGEIVTVTFTSFETEPSLDGLYVYDGDSVNAPQIMSNNDIGFGNMTEPGAYWGNEIPGPFTATSESGCLTFHFKSGGSNNMEGFLANITCSPAPECQKPTALSNEPVTTTTTATLSWTQVGSASEWLVYAYPCDTPVPTPGSAGGILTAQTSVTLENLEPATCYNIAVFSVCDGPLYSEPAIRVAITQVAPPVCDGIFMDPAGPANYESNTNYTVTICPDTPDSFVKVEFLEFDIQENFDGIYIYDGDSTSAPQFDSGNVGGWLPYLLEPGAYSGTDIPGPFAATNESGCLTFHFMSSPTVNSGGWFANVICEPFPPCRKPTALTVGFPLDHPSPSEAEVSWTNVGDATSWEVIAVPCGSPVPTATDNGIVTTEIPFVYTGLDPDTCYEFFVRADCSSTGEGLSDWSGPVTLTTEPVPPACGEVFADEGGPDEDYPLISNSIVTICPENAGDIVTVYFNSFEVHSGDKLYVYDGSLTSSPQIESINNSTGAFTGTAIPEPFEATNPDGCLTFEFISINSSPFADTSLAGWTADVICTPAPTCDKPTNIVVMGVTQTSVTLDWTETGSATEWQILVIPYSDPYPAPEATGWQTANAHPFTYEPLNPGTFYKVYVRAACSADDTSTWSYYQDFNTLIENDFCAGAIEISVNQNADCGQTLTSTLTGANPSGIVPGFEYPCIGTNNMDAWYKFTAVGANHYIRMFWLNAEGIPLSSSPSFALFSGSCDGNLTPIGCSDGNQYFIAEGLIPGETYYIQAFTLGAFSDNFNICIGTIPPTITTSGEYTNEELVHDILFNRTCATIDNITSSTGTDFGSVNGIGYFNKNDSGFPFKEGVILSTGYIGNAPGPNAFENFDGNLQWTGDDDLEAIILEGTGTVMQSYNATILEFNFIPVIPQIKFDFVFASDEYGVYQCSYSDSFAFILTDLTEPLSAPVNLAVVPNSNIPVSVITIRDEIFSGLCESQNPEYFDEYYGEFRLNVWEFMPEALTPMAAPINFYGSTVPLTAYSEVIPGHQYHIKMVIADRGDAALDSAVFIEAGSFDIGNIQLGSDFLIAEGTAICEDSYTINTDLPAADYTFVWMGNDEVIENETGSSLVVSDNGSYTVIATFNNSECSASDTVVIEFYTPGILEPLENEIVCMPYTFPIPTIGHYYSEPGGQGDIMDGTIVSDIGEYQFFLYYSSGPDCANEESFTVTILESLQTEVIEDVFSCGPYSLPELPGITYYNLAGANGETVTSITETQEVYAYLRGSSPDCWSEQNFMVYITDIPELEIYGNCDGNEYALEVKVLNPVPGAEYSFNWDSQNGEIISTTDSARVIVSLEGTYYVTVTLNNCDGYAEKLVSATSCFIQRGISPNGDGMNDFFDLRGLNVEKLQIVNRYGVKVYEKSPYNNEWDGMSENDEELPDGTYFYVIEFEEDTKPKAGWIYLIREN